MLPRPIHTASPLLPKTSRDRRKDTHLLPIKAAPLPSHNVLFVSPSTRQCEQLQRLPPCALALAMAQKAASGWAASAGNCSLAMRKWGRHARGCNTLLHGHVWFLLQTLKLWHQAYTETLVPQHSPISAASWMRLFQYLMVSNRALISHVEECNRSASLRSPCPHDQRMTLWLVGSKRVPKTGLLSWERALASALLLGHLMPVATAHEALSLNYRCSGQFIVSNGIIPYMCCLKLAAMLFKKLLRLC
jgi:hypothetical protein